METEREEAIFEEEELKKKFVEFDMKPLCTKCFEKFPSELKKRIKKNNSKKGFFWNLTAFDLFNTVFALL